MSFFKNIWKSNSKHAKLSESEELALQNAKDSDSQSIELTDNEVVTFKLKYLGSTVVEKIPQNGIKTEPLKRILKAAKANGKKSQRVVISISRKGITVTDLQGSDIYKESIYRISNCSAYSVQRHIFSFISTDSNETMECYAFVCSNRKLAETVTLAVAHAFSNAYEAWRILPTTQEFTKTSKNIETDKENHSKPENDLNNSSRNDLSIEEKLIDFEDMIIEERPPIPNALCSRISNSNWVSFEDDFSLDEQKNPEIN